MRIAIDVIGSDHGPEASIHGALAGLRQRPDVQELLLVGPADEIHAWLEKGNLGEGANRVRVIPASQVIEAHESPVVALRQKRDSSIVRLVELAAKGQADAVISAGNTGAFVAACQLGLQLIPGVPRCGVVCPFPTSHGMVLMCDCGANIEPKPHHLHAYALLTSAFAEVVLKRPRPRVGLMNVGREDDKGNALCKAVYPLLAGDANLNFVGNMEGRDIYSGICDVVLTDGFTGNVVLKAVETHFFNLLQMAGNWVKDQPSEVQQAVQGLTGHLMKEHDYQEYGGAHILGPMAVCLKCHGSSDEKSFKNAVVAAAQAVAEGLCGVMVERLKGLAGRGEGKS